MLNKCWSKLMTMGSVGISSSSMAVSNFVMANVKCFTTCQIGQLNNCLSRAVQIRTLQRRDFSRTVTVNADESGTGDGGTKTEVDGIELNWEKFGNGPHVALCLPGLLVIFYK